MIDVRRRAAFEEQPEAIPGALPLALDHEPLEIPDVARDRPVVAYCLCKGEASSARVAQWLAREGYRKVAVLIGGLDAWTEANLPTQKLEVERAHAQVRWTPVRIEPVGRARVFDPDSAFLPRLAGQNFLAGRELPLKRDMAVLFVDMVDSTRLVLGTTADQVLEIVQAFMEIVVDVGVHHCGDVHDFEGDGALLYFEGIGEAVPAAFRLRDALLERRRALAALPLPRISLDVGPVVIGIVGTRFRQAVALVGASVHTAAKILKLAPPGGIVATDAVVEQARRSSPDFARAFAPFEGRIGSEPGTPPARLWLAPVPARVG